VRNKASFCIHWWTLSYRCIAVLYNNSDKQARILKRVLAKAAYLGTPLLIGAQICTLPQPYEHEIRNRGEVQR
jgi:hypothetical protein